MEYSKETHWKINKHWVKCLLASSFIIAILTALALPMYSNYTDRSRISVALVGLADAKTTVAEFIVTNPASTPIKINLEKTNAIPLGILKGQKSDDGHIINLEYRHIDESGTIHVIFSGLNFYLRLTPFIEGKRVSWQCSGSPQKDMPAQCRNSSS